MLLVVVNGWMGLVLDSYVVFGIVNDNSPISNSIEPPTHPPHLLMLTIRPRDWRRRGRKALVVSTRPKKFTSNVPWRFSGVVLPDARGCARHEHAGAGVRGRVGGRHEELHEERQQQEDEGARRQHAQEGGRQRADLHGG